MQSNPGKVVTKYQFSALLNKVWMLTMIPSDISSGFRCGVYPFNLNAIDYSLTSPSSTSGACKVTIGDGGVKKIFLKVAVSFLLIKICSFRGRLYDPEYVRWPAVMKK